MAITFWVINLLLLLSAFGFVLPWLRSTHAEFLCFFAVLLTTYGLYHHLGSSRYLSHYYSPSQVLERVKQIELRQLVAEFRKEEFRLTLRLEENPNDNDAEWRLLDILAIKSLQKGDKAEARGYWEKALLKMPEEYKPQFKDRISQWR